MATHKRSAPWENERGSTLILVVLLTLILSASAIVALRNVARSTQAASVFQTRNQAQLTSDSASRLFADWVGSKAGTLIDAMDRSMRGETSGGAGDVFGARGGATPDEETRKTASIVGGSLQFSYSDLQSDCAGTCVPLIEDHSDPRETGLFQLAAGEQTFETQRTARWRVTIRDLTDGFPAVGYSNEFCFKKATIAAEAQVGRMDARWDRANNVSQARHGIDGMIGPVECGYN